VQAISNSQNNFYHSQLGKIKAEDKETASVNSGAYAQNPIKSPSFTAAPPPLTLRTKLTGKEEKAKYNALQNNLSKDDRKSLELILKNGRLLNTNSNDKTSTLDNLYKILTIPRANGLDKAMVLKETVAILADPYIITQLFGDIPQKDVKSVLERGNQNSIYSGKQDVGSSNLIKKFQEQPPSAQNAKLDENLINVEHSGSCVAASIEFNLATEMPAEFARFAEGLSSKNLSVKKNIEIKNLANNSLDAVWLLNAFEVPYKMDDFKSAQLTLAPDKNAIIRAQIQNSNKDNLVDPEKPDVKFSERSLVDVLMQSTFMNVGSQQSYNSLTDSRSGKFNQNDKGLIEFEKTFTESVVEDKNKISVTYQTVDENAKLVGYETDFKTIKKHILDSLAMGENVIIGYTQTDDTNTIINGHEITIVGAREGKDGKLIFTCNDTDDNNPKSIEYTEDYIIPKIHHAGLPQAVVEKDVEVVDNWVEGVNAYKNAKKEATSKQPSPTSHN